jgi:hypothetical protein
MASKPNIESLTPMQRIFAQSKANGATYEEPESIMWEWPTSTWFARRLKKLRGMGREQ